jgi:hypothetical protein
MPATGGNLAHLFAVVGPTLYARGTFEDDFVPAFPIRGAP